RHRAGDRGDRSGARELPRGVAAVLRRRLRAAHRPRRPAGTMSPGVKIPMPLRVPELASSLGRLLVPRRLEEPWVPLDDLREERAIAARLAAGGEAFVAALDALDGAGLLVRDAGVLDKTLHAEWQDALRAAARRLEAAWLALETGVAEERRRWAVETDAIARWRPSLWPVIVGLTPLAAGLIWLGLVLGGY